MLSAPGSIRLWITAGVLLGAFCVAACREPWRTSRFSAARSVSFPILLRSWKGEEHPLEERIVQAVSVSDYTNRIYRQSGRPTGPALYWLLRESKDWGYDSLPEELPAGGGLGPDSFRIRHDFRCQTGDRLSSTNM